MEFTTPEFSELLSTFNDHEVRYLIVGGFAERMKFSALMLFVALWVTFVYFPVAHMVWYWAGPDAIGDAAKALAGAAGATAKSAAEAKLAAVEADARPTG